MRLAVFIAFSVVLLVPAPFRGAEMSIATNFTVLAPNRAVADGVAAQAEVFRKDAAVEWLNEKLPDRVHTVTIVRATSSCCAA